MMLVMAALFIPEGPISVTCGDASGHNYYVDHSGLEPRHCILNEKHLETWKSIGLEDWE